MLGKMIRSAVLFLAMIVILLPLLVACGGDDGSPQPPPTSGDGQTPTPGPEPVVINIGNLTDKTGASSNAMSIIDMALKDAVKYYNDQGLIPGVKLNVIEYDGAYDPSNDIPGYEWLKERGADLIFTGVPATPTTLKARVNRDQIVMFTPAASKDALVPPGYIFNLSTLPEDNAYTMLAWISEHDPDFPTDRPARIGGAGWATPYNLSLHDAMKRFAEEHPDLFEWEGSYTTDMSFTWQTEAEALKDCDYVMLPIIMTNFIKTYRDAGSEGKFLGTGAQLAFLGMIDDARLWEEFEGSLFILPSGWWTDDNEMIRLTRELLYLNHPDNADDIISEGASYISIDSIYQMLDIIKAAVEKAGADNFDSQALYEAAQSFSQTLDGITRVSFSETKRASTDYLAIYEADAAEKDLFRVEDEWYPVVRFPLE